MPIDWMERYCLSPEEEERRFREDERRVRQRALDNYSSAVRGYIPPEYVNARVEDFPAHLYMRIDWQSVKGIFIPGDVGIGKTHFATALAIHALAPGGPFFFAPLYPEASRLVRWVETPMLMHRITKSFNHNSPEKAADIIEEMTSCRVLVLDDLGSEKITDFTAATLHTIVSRRGNHHKMTIVTSNQSINEINKWEPRIASRLNAFLQINLPDIDRRAQSAPPAIGPHP